MQKLIAFLSLIIPVLLFSGCKNFDKNADTSYFRTDTIFIQPLGKVSPKVIDYLKESIHSFYKKPTRTLPVAPFTDDLLAKSRTRYEANKILSRFKSDKNIIIITEKDIAFRNRERKSDEWGIFGLGYRPGKTCVVSTFRLKRNADEEKYKIRIQKVCIHELGHNLGLNHCNKSMNCIMHAANGTISQVDREVLQFCESFKMKLK